MLSPKLPWDLANPKWAAELNPIIANPMTNMNIIHAVLVPGTNIINHGLGKVQQGWVIVDIQGVASIYRDANLNSTTLSLNSSAGVSVSIGVF